MPDFENLTDREILVELKRLRGLAEAATRELLRRANDEGTE